MNHIWISFLLTLMIVLDPLWSTSVCHLCYICKLYEYVYHPFLFPIPYCTVSDDPDTQHTTMSDYPLHISIKIVYCSRFHDGKICYKKSSHHCSVFSINKGLYYCHVPVIMVSQLRTCFIQNHHCIDIFTVDWCVCLPSFHYSTCWTHFCAWFIPDFLFPHSSNYSVCCDWCIHLVLFLAILMHVINSSAWYLRYIFINTWLYKYFFQVI